MLKVAKVLDNGKVVDVDGNEVEGVPSYTIRNALDTGKALKQIETTTGGTQWRLIDTAVFDELAKTAKPLAKSHNTISSTEASNVMQYLNNCGTSLGHRQACSCRGAATPRKSRHFAPQLP